MDDPRQVVETPTTEAQVTELAGQVARGELPADAYFAAIDRRAANMIDHETTGGTLLQFLVRSWPTRRRERRTA